MKITILIPLFLLSSISLSCGQSRSNTFQIIKTIDSLTKASDIKICRITRLSESESGIGSIGFDYNFTFNGPLLVVTETARKRGNRSYYHNMAFLKYFFVRGDELHFVF